MKLPLSFGYLNLRLEHDGTWVFRLWIVLYKVIRQPLKFKHIEYPRSEKNYQRLLKVFAWTVGKITNSSTSHCSQWLILQEWEFQVINLLISDIDSKRMIILFEILVIKTVLFHWVKGFGVTSYLLLGINQSSIYLTVSF
jgi:hypothetical protein